MGHKLGRKHALLTISPIFSMGFLCQAFAQDVYMLLFGRFITGCAAGLACGPTAVRRNANNRSHYYDRLAELHSLFLLQGLCE